MPELPEATQRVVDAAARRGVNLDVTLFGQTTHTADDAARALGVEIGQIVKSLVFVSDSIEGPEPYLVLASGANTVDLSLMAAVLTVPHLRRATATEAHELTGFAIGGIPPFGHRRQIRTVMDPDLARHDTVWAAAGSAHTVFPIAPATLRVLANAVVTPIAAGPLAPLDEQGAGASTTA